MHTLPVEAHCAVVQVRWTPLARRRAMARFMHFIIIISALLVSFHVVLCSILELLFEATLDFYCHDKSNFTLTSSEIRSGTRGRALISLNTKKLRTRNHTITHGPSHGPVSPFIFISDSEYHPAPATRVLKGSRLHLSKRS